MSENVLPELANCNNNGTEIYADIEKHLQVAAIRETVDATE